MSKATTIDSALILPFIQATKNDQPSKSDITKYVKAENPPEAEVAQLEAWQKAHEDGLIETEICTNCWAISVMDVNSTAEPVLINQCDDCQKTICNCCHVHVPGPSEQRCLCTECAQSTETVPVEYSDVKQIIYHYTGRCEDSGKDHLDGRVLNGYIQKSNFTPDEISALRDWRAKLKKGKLIIFICRLCSHMSISEHEIETAHECLTSEPAQPTR